MGKWASGAALDPGDDREQPQQDGNQLQYVHTNRDFSLGPGTQGGQRGFWASAWMFHSHSNQSLSNACHAAIMLVLIHAAVTSYHPVTDVLSRMHHLSLSQIAQAACTPVRERLSNMMRSWPFFMSPVVYG